VNIEEEQELILNTPGFPLKNTTTSLLGSRNISDASNSKPSWLAVGDSYGRVTLLNTEIDPLVEECEFFSPPMRFSTSFHSDKGLVLIVVCFVLICACFSFSYFSRHPFPSLLSPLLSSFYSSVSIFYVLPRLFSLKKITPIQGS